MKRGRAGVLIACLCGVLSGPPGAWAWQPAVETAPNATAQVSKFVPDASAPFLPFDKAWPPRWNRDNQRVQGVVRTLDVKVTTLWPNRTGGLSPASDDGREDFGLLSGGKAAPDLALELEGANSIVFESNPGARQRGLGTGPGPDAGPAPAFVFRFISGEAAPAAPGAAGAKERVQIQRAWFAYYEPVGERVEGERRPAPPTKATVLILPGIFGNPEPTIDALVLKLRVNGYAVLRMLCQPSRFTELVTFVVDPADLGGVGARIARHYDNRAAECAYAAEGAWAFVEEKRPQVKGLACLVIGMSGGAITLPAVVAHEPGRYAGAVLIGGAADYWLVSQRSNYRGMIGAVGVVWKGDGPTEERHRELDRAYLENARLDSFHAAAALKGRPVLVLQGLADQAVPSALGDLLFERLGRPERWTYPLGHELLFAGLPTEFARLVAWMDGVVEKEKDKGGGPP